MDPSAAEVGTGESRPVLRLRSVPLHPPKAGCPVSSIPFDAAAAARAITRQLEPFVEPGQIVELRVLGYVEYPGASAITMSGWFDTSHLSELARAAAMVTTKASGVYVTANPIRAEVRGRAIEAGAWNQLVRRVKTATGDADIEKRRALLLDFDPERPAGTSATDEEKALAEERCNQVVSFLRSLVWPEPVLADSGNGSHARYILDLPADDAGLVKRVLAALHAAFSDDQVKIDTSLFNLSRIIKLYGTLARKGQESPERPHRLSRVVSLPPEYKAVSRAQLEALLEVLEPEPKPPSQPTIQPSRSGNPSTDEKPGDAFEAIAPWPEILEPVGWKKDRERGGTIYWTRPGKDQGVSATTGYTRGLYVFTSNAPPFAPNTNYSKFQAYALLYHGGDFKAAAQTLAAQGYGSKPSPNGQPMGTTADQKSFGTFGTPPREQNPIIWGDPKPIRPELLPVPTLDASMIPEPLRDWLVDITDRTKFPLEFTTVSALFALGVVLGRRIGIRPNQYTPEWTVISCLWGAIIGRPGTMKSPAMEQACMPLTRLEIAASKRFKEETEELAFADTLGLGKAEQVAAAKKLAKELMQAGGSRAAVLAKAREKFPDLGEKAKDPVERRYTTNAATCEAVGKLLAGGYAIGVKRDELQGWLVRLSQEEHAAERGFFNSCFQGTQKCHRIDRVTRECLNVPNPTIGVLGGIQPGPLKHFLRDSTTDKKADDGLVSRLQMMVWPDIKGPWIKVSRWPDTAAKARAFKVFEDLDKLDPLSIGATQENPDDIPVLKFSEQAQELFDAWHEQHMNTKVRSDREHPVLISHFGKYPSLCAGLALLFHLCDSRSSQVGVDSVRLAIEWCQFFEAHARRVYACVTSDPIDSALALAEKIKAGKLGSQFKQRDVYRHHWTDLDSPRLVAGAVDILEAHGWVHVAEISETGGRPSEIIHVNPALLENGKNGAGGG
jgi:hypothetical protein